MLLFCFFFSFLCLLVQIKQKQTNKRKIIYELCVGQEWQLEVRHVSSWHVDDFPTEKKRQTNIFFFKSQNNNNKRYIHVL